MTTRADERPLLIVDDEPALRQTLAILFKRRGFAVTVAKGHREAVDALNARSQPFPLVLTDLSMPDGSGFDVLAAAKSRSPSTQVVLITAHSTVESAVQAMAGGAYDFVTKPFDTAELCALIEKAYEKYALITENALLRARVSREDRSIIGKSPAMQELLGMVARIASAKTTVLLTGESGTGKEKVARAIHDASDRADRPFLVVNCGALPENLMESELFGHEKGAFTGASERTLGMFREADGGTLLLDEVGELPQSLQVKLLRILQEKKVRPVGGIKEVPVDVRLLAATNRDIEAEVSAGNFRQDLYYRINVIRLRIPPLRERVADVPLLAEAFLSGFAAEHRKELRGFTPDALRALSGYDYPGNVRELENLVERAAALSGSSRIGLGDLPESVSGSIGAPAARLLELPEQGCELDEVLAEVERRFLIEALARSSGVRTQAAKILGISFRSLRYRMAKHSLGEEEEDGMGDEGDVSKVDSSSRP